MARSLGVRGFVRNEADGTVTIEAEAVGPDLEQFLNWCRRGPSGASVSDVHVAEGAVKDFKEFEMRF